MRKVNVLILLILLFFIGMKNSSETKSSIPFAVITFINGTSILDNEGRAHLDSLGKYFRCNEELLDKGILIFIPYNSKVEFDSNQYIGIERYREIVKILNEKYKIEVNRKVLYRDNFYEKNNLYKGQTGMTCQFLVTQ